MWNLKMKRYLRASILVLVLLCCCTTADGQLFKKWKKKKIQAEAVEVKQTVNLDTLQLAMADIATCPDNKLNRMAFLEIPLGISAKGFHDRLTAQGFAEPADQQNYYYLYQGTAFGSQVRLILMQSDSTRTVYAVDIEETTIRQSETDARRRFMELKKQLQEVYGDGYVCNGGEQYVINTPLGSVTLHYERTTGGGGFVVGYAIEDAKADALAYAEAEDKGGEELPRTIHENGLAYVERHADIVGLGQMLLQAATPQKARVVLALYDYTLGKETAAVLPASFRMGDYQAWVSIPKRAKTLNAVTVTANDRADLVKADLERIGYTPQETGYSNGVLTATVKEEANGQLSLTFAKPGAPKNSKPVRGRRR